MNDAFDFADLIDLRLIGFFAHFARCSGAADVEPEHRRELRAWLTAWLFIVCEMCCEWFNIRSTMLCKDSRLLRAVVAIVSAERNSL